MINAPVRTIAETSVVKDVCVYSSVDVCAYSSFFDLVFES